MLCIASCVLKALETFYSVERIVELDFVVFCRGFELDIMTSGAFVNCLDTPEANSAVQQYVGMSPCVLFKESGGCGFSTETDQRVSSAGLSSGKRR